MLSDRLRGLDRYPFHMPGHKRNSSLFDIDFTEIDGSDDLHNPKGIIKEAMDYAAEVYESRGTYFLINGSTCGIMAALGAALKPGETLLMARNCHKSVYNSAALMGFDTAYVYPPILKSGILGGISADEVKKALNETKAGVFIMVSPTYEGVVSDIEKISKVCHDMGCVLIVDEAHGAHFEYHSAFPVSALRLGADIVIQSLHKTLPSLTQTALLHMGSYRVSPEKISKYLSFFETSSPSYVLMSSIDGCIRYMTSDKGRNAMEAYVRRLKNFRKRAEGHILELEGESVFDRDISKIVIPGGKITATRLRMAGLEPEMSGFRHTIAMTSVGDTDEGFERLLEVVKEIPAEHFAEGTEALSIPKTKAVLPIYKAALYDSERAELSRAEGRICAESVYIYPPGIPIVAPGEVFTKEIIKTVDGYIKNGFETAGTENGRPSCVLD